MISKESNLSLQGTCGQLRKLAEQTAQEGWTYSTRSPM